MDLETIRRINREALRAAQEAEGQDQVMSYDMGMGMGMNQQMMTMYLVAAIVGVAVFFILRAWKPAFVLKKNAAGDAVFSNLKGVLSGIVAALLVVLVYQYMW